MSKNDLASSSTKHGKVYLIPTVIAEDTMDQALPVSIKVTVNSLRYFLVENVRTARRFLSALGIQNPIDNLHFEELNKRTSKVELKSLFAPVMQGENIGIMSEAGCPGVADPGALAVNYAHEHHIQVIPLVGPSSFLLALMASGFNGQSFAFHGYLPIDKGERNKAVKQLEKQAQDQHQTQIFMETPYRNNQLFEAVLKNCKNTTQLCVARGVTGSDEYIKTMNIGDWKKNKPDLHKIPTVFLIYA
ncbi:SAM-dependent methyltransferase [Catalinimonas niigatensis]|uniref:SAM-dependent methyltransferase n=1 Tax=Catalinimonas niigatensis TaxID=1397264 RepID=UPI002666B6B7|nr:SAM-dependent methyltransferase [Catalinimonas niigatensis]WPP53494.1 SAM-dependent methyltransferase [Catalinimonas niigatensis]